MQIPARLDVFKALFSGGGGLSPGTAGVLPSRKTPQKRLRPHPRWRPLYAAGCRWGRCGYSGTENSGGGLALLCLDLRLFGHLGLRLCRRIRRGPVRGFLLGVFLLGSFLGVLAFFRLGVSGRKTARLRRDTAASSAASGLSFARLGPWPVSSAFWRFSGFGRTVTRPAASRAVSVRRRFRVRAASSITEPGASVIASAWVGLGCAGSVLVPAPVLGTRRHPRRRDRHRLLASNR